MTLRLENVTRRVGAQADPYQRHRTRLGPGSSGTLTPFGVHVTNRNRGSGRLHKWEAL